MMMFYVCVFLPYVMYNRSYVSKVFYLIFIRGIYNHVLFIHISPLSFFLCVLHSLSLQHSSVQKVGPAHAYMHTWHGLGF